MTRTFSLTNYRLTNYRLHDIWAEAISGKVKEIASGTPAAKK